ncbi:hypothetical protein J7426_11325 [Tropicibacter sp. R16_0]|uniref:hypothetical protein n=1 Tax=Tropicibacter sp. R16_0 TaxID=2821102 RepID=UPI001ADB9205|nr:hypothetical protein [Tropicibacter sp. R16_0]MBO9450853.1 hypothetical protein [Tropicibacter sp. R16_0]
MGIELKKIQNLKFWLTQALWFVPLAYFVNFFYAVLSDQKGGTFGDTFGASNALFSGTALLMLVLAVTLQREELQEVKNERNDTRKLLAGQEELNSKQEAALKKQSFEQSFFSLVRLISEERRVLDSTTLYSNEVTIAARASYDARFGINETKSLDAWEISDFIERFGTPSRLLITAFGLLSEQDFTPQDSLIYASTLHALMDADFAHVFIVLAHRWRGGDPRIAPTVAALQIRDFLDPDIIPVFDTHFKQTQETR